MVEAIDFVVVERIRARGRDLGLVPPAKRVRRSAVPRIPDILCCTFDDATDSFHVVYEDFSSADVWVSELAESDGRQVVAWSVDEFRRGVEVVYADGGVTSFSAEYPRYLRDEDYRRRVDARNGGRGEDLGMKVARRVRAVRTSRKWSVAELARRAGMAAPNVHRIESGKHVPTMTTVVRLAQALDVPLEMLLRSESEPPVAQQE